MLKYLSFKEISSWRSLKRHQFMFSNVLTATDKSQVEHLQNISKMPFYRSYCEGVKLTMENKLFEANNSYQQALKDIEASRQSSGYHYIYILKKIATNNLAMRRMKNVEENIYSILKFKRKKETSEILLCDTYEQLMLHYLNYDLNKAILLGKALLVQSNRQNLPVKNEKKMLFLLGNAYLLSSNFEDAKKKYSQCLDTQPTDELKIYTLNNLGLACWWHKNPLYLQNPLETDKLQLIDKDFNQAKGLFSKAIYCSERVDSIIDQQAKYTMKETLSEMELNTKVLFIQKTSVIPLYNISMFLLNNDPMNRALIMFWLQMTLKTAHQTEEFQYMDEVLTTIYMLSNNIDKLQEELPKKIQQYRNQPQCLFYLKIKSLLFKFQEDATREKIDIEREKLLQKVLQTDKNYFKKKHIMNYKLNFFETDSKAK